MKNLESKEHLKEVSRHSTVWYSGTFFIMLFYIFSLNIAPDPPVEVVISMVTSTTAILSWQAPLDPQGIIASYNVSYNQTIPCSGNVSSFEIMLTRDNFTYTFVDLEEATNYVFSVTVMNGVRESETVSVSANTSESSKFNIHNFDYSLYYTILLLLYFSSN